MDSVALSSPVMQLVSFVAVQITKMHRCDSANTGLAYGSSVDNLARDFVGLDSAGKKQKLKNELRSTPTMNQKPMLFPGTGKKEHNCVSRRHMIFA
jgi:hypothetical protein